MKITIITVCYNSAKTIEKTIQSVISQNYHDLEYIIIDGASTDNTLDIIRKYQNDISYCISERDNGIYDAMNKGLSKASGEVIAFLNSDDWYLPGVNVLERVERYFNENGTDIVSGGIYVYKDAVSNKAMRYKSVEDTIFFDIVCPHPAMFVKRALYERFGGFDVSYQIAADTKWIMNAYMNGAKILCVEDYFTCFRDGGISSIHKYEALKEQYQAALSCIRETDMAELEEKINSYYIAKLNRMEQERYIETALEKQQNKIRAFFQQYEKYYIWGTGNRGKECLQMFEKLGIRAAGFIDSYKCRETIYGCQIIEPQDMDEAAGICITPKDYEEEIITQLNDMEIEKNRFFTFSELKERIIKIAQECADENR